MYIISSNLKQQDILQKIVLLVRLLWVILVSDLLNNFMDFNKRTMPKDTDKEKLKQDTIENLNAL